MIIKGYKYRIYPNKEQQMFLNKHFGSCRFVYNWGLDKKIKHYEKTKKSISWVELNNILPELKKEYIWLKEIGSQSLQMEIRNLDTAFKNFFRTTQGFPKFKSKKNNHKSFQILHNKGHYKIVNNKLYIPKLKSGIKIKQHRLFEGKMKTLTISVNPSGQYFASILVETTDNVIESKAIREETTIGIDLGIKDFLITSDGNKISNPKFLKKSEKKLAKEQKRLSKKQNGSNNKNRKRTKVAKIYQKIVNQREDFLHKLSSKLVSENQAICIENLDVKKMMKNRIFSKAISDASWNSFTRKLNYKSSWHGANLITIGRFEPSSKLCSSCGNINNNLILRDREWKCNCGIKHDRDVNAAINIKNFGLVKSNYPLLKLNTVGTTEINACQIRTDVSHSGQENIIL